MIDMAMYRIDADALSEICKDTYSPASTWDANLTIMIEAMEAWYFNTWRSITRPDTSDHVVDHLHTSLMTATFHTFALGFLAGCDHMCGRYT